MDQENSPSSEEAEAAFVENYFDYVEELPNDVQRKLTQMLELDVSQRGIVKNLEILAKLIEGDETESEEARENLLEMEKLLMSLDEIGEEKCEASQSISDLLTENIQRTEELAANLESTSEEATSEDSEPVEEPANTEIQKESSCCICQQEKGGDISICANEMCPMGKFFCNCVESKSEPKRRKWFCPLCSSEYSNFMKPEEEKIEDSKAK